MILFELGIHADVQRADGTIVQEAIQFFRSVPLSRAIVSFIQWWLWCGQTVIMLMADEGRNAALKSFPHTTCP